MLKRQEDEDKRRIDEEFARRSKTFAKSKKEQELDDIFNMSEEDGNHSHMDLNSLDKYSIVKSSRKSDSAVEDLEDVYEDFRKNNV
jgi:hypothetical protein